MRDDERNGHQDFAGRAAGLTPDVRVRDVLLGLFSQSLSSPDVRQQIRLGDGGGRVFDAAGTGSGEGGLDEPIHADLFTTDDQVTTVTGQGWSEKEGNVE